jgi:DNA-binding response OmpR family regulator
VSYNILISEDDIKLTRYLKNSLDREGFSVDIANDGEAALQQWEKKPYHLVILDLVTPKKTGGEILTYIRKKSHIPVIIVSGEATEQDKQRLKSQKCEFLEKPVKLNVLIDKINEALAGGTATMCH